MTHRLPSNHRQTVAIAVPAQIGDHKSRIALLIGVLICIFCFLMASVALGQTDSEISEEEAASQAETTTEVEFDLFGGEPPVSIEQLRDMQEHFEELSRDVTDATVSIQVGQNQGTGVIVTRDGYIMTAAHVIGGANREATIKLPNGDELKAKTLGLNRTVDSGLLKIIGDGKYPYLNPGISESLKNGQWVMAIGHPGGFEEDRGLVFRVGRILRHRADAISTDCSLVGGDSGGPLVDMNGEVIGIHSRIGLSLTDNIHVPVDVFSEQWDDLSKARDWGRGIGGTNPANEPWLGFSLEEETLVVESTIPDGPAAKAGLEVGDRLVSIDGVRIRNQRHFRALFRVMEPGKELTLTIRRGEEEKELDMKIGSKADMD